MFTANREFDLFYREMSLTDYPKKTYIFVLLIFIIGCYNSQIETILYELSISNQIYDDLSTYFNNFCN